MHAFVVNAPKRTVHSFVTTHRDFLLAFLSFESRHESNARLRLELYDVHPGPAVLT